MQTVLRILNCFQTPQRCPRFLLTLHPAIFIWEQTTALSLTNWKWHNLLEIIQWYILLLRRILTPGRQKWQRNRFTLDHSGRLRHIHLRMFWSQLGEVHPNFNDEEFTIANTQGVRKFTPKVRTSKLIWELTPAKNHINALGKAVSGGLLVQMSLQGILESIPEPNHLSVSSVIELSRDPIIWRCIWSDINHNNSHRWQRTYANNLSDYGNWRSNMASLNYPCPKFINLKSTRKLLWHLAFIFVVLPLLVYERLKKVSTINTNISENISVINFVIMFEKFRFWIMDMVLL